MLGLASIIVLFVQHQGRHQGTVGAAAAWEARSTTGQQLLATAAYAPPEQIAGGRASPVGDLYSLGVVLYEMLTGRLPSLVDSPERLLRAPSGSSTPAGAGTGLLGAARDRRRLRGDAGQGPDRAAVVGGALAARLRAASQAARASAATLPFRTIGPDRPPSEPIRRLPAGHVEVVGGPHRARCRSPVVMVVAAVVLLVAAVALWRTTSPDRARPVHSRRW